MKNFQSYYDTVRYLESLSCLSDIKKYAKDQKPENYLKKTRYFLNLLGNPQNNFKIVHITGTSGKGSVANIVQHLLYKNGNKAGLFTSPYASTSIEKIKVNNLLIDPDEFVLIVDYLKPFIDKVYKECPYGPVSYFEIFLAIAFEYFRRQKCQWAVLEVGLGGRYDATNISERSEITAITCIDYDHTNILGRTLTKIAKDKSGIIKKDSVFLTSEKRPHLLKVLNAEAQKNGAKKFIRVNGGNEELAYAIAKEMGLKNLSSTGLQKLPCRFETVQAAPLVILDGAHNPSKIKYSLNRLKKLNKKKLIFVLAVAEDKDCKAILKEIATVADQIFLTRFLISDRQCASPAELLRLYKLCNGKGKAEVLLDPFMALYHAIKAAKKNDVVFVTGSFYLTGDLRKHWHKEEDILNKRSV